MRRSFVLLLHVGFWACYFVLIAIMLAVYYRSSGSYGGNQEARILNAFKSLFLFAFLPSFISYWSYYLVVFPRYLQHKRVSSSIILGLAISTAAAMFSYILIRFSIESGYMIDMDDAGRHGRSTAITV